MKLSDIHRYHSDRDYHDRELYKDHFKQKDNAFTVVVFKKPWKSFPTQEAAQRAADSVNSKKGRLVAFVQPN